MKGLVQNKTSLYLEIFGLQIKQEWKDWIFASQANACWHKSQWHQFMCKTKSLTISHSSKLVLKVSNKKIHLVAECVMGTI